MSEEYGASDFFQGEVDEQEAEAKLAREQLQLDYTIAFDTEHGRRVLYDLLEKCHLFVNPFHRDPCVHAFNSGEMNIGQYVMQVMQMKPEMLQSLQNEHDEPNNQ